MDRKPFSGSAFSGFRTCSADRAAEIGSPDPRGPTYPRPTAAEFRSPAVANGSQVAARRRVPGVRTHRCRSGRTQRRQLEHLCRYITRPAVANERSKRNHAGQVVLQLNSAYKDGTTHSVMSPLQFMQRRAALVPPPRLPLIRFHDVLGPHAQLRAAIVPTPENAPEHAADHAHGASARMRLGRACSSESSISTSNTARDSRRHLEDYRCHRRARRNHQVLTHLGLPTRAPPRSPARRPDLFQAA